MPRDAVGPVGITRPWLESRADQFIPDLGHIADNVVLLDDGSVMAMVLVPGSPFELEEINARNINCRQYNELLRNISDDNVMLGVHLVHHARVPDWTLGRFRSRFAEDVMRKLRDRLSDLHSDDWFLTVVVMPRLTPVQAMHKWFKRHHTPQAGEGLLRQLDAAMHTLMAYLAPCGARRLGYRESGGYLYSEIAEARRLILTGTWCPVPLVSGSIAQAIYNERITCGTRAIRLDTFAGPRYAKVIAIKEYPATTRTGQLSQLLNLGCAFVMAHSFHCHSRPRTQSSIHLKRVRMQNAFDPQFEAQQRLGEEMERVESGEIIRGQHNATLTIYADSIAELYIETAKAGTIFVKSGIVPVVEDGNSFAAFWSKMSGNAEWLAARSGTINTRNFAALAGFEGFPVGETQGHWGPAIMRFRTRGGTAFNYQPHVGDVGHTLFVGKTGSGKTLLMALLAVALEQAIGNEGSLVLFDKDCGSELMVRACGGTYLTLKAGEPSGLAPLRGLSDTPANRAFLEEWIAALMQLDGRGIPSAETLKRLRRGVARQLRMPPEQRRMGALRAFLGFEPGGDGERLDVWCRDGALGWMFDNATDDVKIDSPLVGFDMTKILEHRACPAVGAYLLHRIRELIDGRKLAVICDECRFYLLNPLFSRIIEDFALTLRKKNGMLWLATQEPGHIINSDVGSSLVNQCPTMFLFGSRTASEEEYIRRLGCTPAMFRALTEEMPVAPYRSVLIKRETGSVIVNTDISGMGDEVAILSGRTETTRLIPEVLARIGDDQDRFVEEFLAAYAATRRTKKENEFA